MTSDKKLITMVVAGHFIGQILTIAVILWLAYLFYKTWGVQITEFINGIVGSKNSINSTIANFFSNAAESLKP